MKYLILISTLLILNQCDNVKTKSNQNSISEDSQYINLSDYDISKQKVDSISDFDFRDATIDSDLNFIPNKKDISNFYKNDYNGNVKQVTSYRKGQNDSYKRFSSMDRFNKKGYKIESEYTYAGTLKYYYDYNNNLIKELKIRDGDTIRVKNINYNKKNEIISIRENHLQESKDYEFNLDVSIEYNSDGSPSKIINKNPNKTYTKDISYIGNKIIITRTDNSKEVTEEIFIYSKTYKLLKHKYGYNTILKTFDKNDRIASSMTYRDNEYCCTDFYKYDNKGIKTNWIFTNHLKDHKEIHTYNHEFDNLDNIIYEHSTDNVTNKENEMFYEIEYFEN